MTVTNGAIFGSLVVWLVVFLMFRKNGRAAAILVGAAFGLMNLICEVLTISAITHFSK